MNIALSQFASVLRFGSKDSFHSDLQQLRNNNYGAVFI